MTADRPDKCPFELLQEIAPDLAAQIRGDARAKNLTPAEAEAKLGAAMEWLSLRERVEKDLKARGIHLSEDDLDEVIGELMLLPTLLQRPAQADADHSETISTQELFRRLGWEEPGGTITVEELTARLRKRGLLPMDPETGRET